MLTTDTTPASLTPDLVTSANGAPLPHGFKARAGGTIMDAHRQWASRPADEAVATVEEFVSRAAEQRRASRTAKAVWGNLTVAAEGDDLALVGGTGQRARLTNWSMGQLASAAGAPAGYLGTLPASLAADCLRHGLANVQRDADASLLLDVSRGVDRATLRGITTTRYTRVWDTQIAEHVSRIASAGTWGPATAFQTATASKVTHAWGEAKPLPLGWIGDRSSFVLLVDYEGSVTTPRGTFARFVMLSNSEVGSASLKVTFGLLDFACSNMILWGCSEVHEASFRHVGKVQDKVASVFAPLSHRLGAGDRDTIVRGVTAASARLLGDTAEQAQKVAAAATGLPQRMVAEAYQRADATPRYGDPRSVWGMLSGLTEASQDAAHTDARLASDVLAAKLMRLAK